MNIQDAYVSVNNLDIKESRRKFGPSWSYVFVNEKLEVVTVEKYKKDLSDVEEKKITDTHKGCVLIIARPGDYTSVSKFDERVKSCKDAFEYRKKNP